MGTNNFYYGMSLVQTLYGIDMKEEDYEEIGLIAWDLIGNKRTRIYRYQVCPNSCDNTVHLPCNADILEAVTTNWEDYKSVSNTAPNGDLHSGFVELYIEYRKSFNDSLYQSGKFIKYERVGDTLYLDRPYLLINILYRGVVLDNEGLPEITDKEALAIATYCAWIVKYKEGLMTNNANIILLAATLKQQWNIQCDLARTDQYLSQNEWDQILDAKTLWGRKLYGKSFKLYK